MVRLKIKTKTNTLALFYYLHSLFSINVLKDKNKFKFVDRYLHKQKLYLRVAQTQRYQ